MTSTWKRHPWGQVYADNAVWGDCADNAVSSCARHSGGDIGAAPFSRCSLDSGHELSQVRLKLDLFSDHPTMETLSFSVSIEDTGL